MLGGHPRLLELGVGIPDGRKLANGKVVHWDSLEWEMIYALICFMAQSGFRKCVVALPAGVVTYKLHVCFRFAAHHILILCFC